MRQRMKDYLSDTTTFSEFSKTLSEDSNIDYYIVNYYAVLERLVM